MAMSLTKPFLRAIWVRAAARARVVNFKVDGSSIGFGLVAYTRVYRTVGLHPRVPECRHDPGCTGTLAYTRV